MPRRLMKIFSIFMLLASFSPAVAQQKSGTPAAPKGPGSQAAKPEAAACARYDSAANAAYGGYIRILKQDMPELGESGGDPAAIADKLQIMYEKLAEDAQSEDPIAYRKLAAIEVFSLYSQRRLMHEMTLRKVCGLAKLPGEAATLLDMVACSVMNLDETRRKVAANRDAARQMMAKAKGIVPSQAGPADGSRILLEEVTRGLDGCY